MLRLKLLPILAVVISCLGLSCSKKGEPVTDPPNTVTLDMLDESNGKTVLGRSNVYINRSNNFYSPSSFIVDLGAVGSLGVDVALRLDDLQSECAVKPGHCYQVFDKRTVFTFPSGTPAIVFSVPYYRMYVVRSIIENSVVVGAEVKYISILPHSYGFSIYNTFLGDVKYGGDRVEMALQDVAECYWGNSVSDLFYVTHSDGKLQLILKDTPPSDGPQFGSYWLSVRLNDVFAQVGVSIVK